MKATQSHTRSAWPTTPQEVSALNDELARTHSIDAYYRSSPLPIRLLQRQRLALIRRMVACQPREKLLEIGSGGGHVLQLFRQGRLTAVDVSPVYLDTARTNLQGYDVEFLQGQIEHLQLPSASFDAIVCSEVLEHTTNPEEILAEVRRLLRANGRAVITVPVDPVIDRAKRVVRLTPVGWLLRNRIQWGGDHYHLQKWWPGQFQHLLERHFHVAQRRLLPTAAFPLHACFKVVHQS